MKFSYFGRFFIVCAVVAATTLVLAVSAWAGSCTSAPPLRAMPSIGVVFNHTSFANGGGGVASGYNQCDDFNHTGLSYSIANGEQKIRITSTASGTGDASVVRWYKA